jgi:hypothetical protein
MPARNRQFPTHRERRITAQKGLVAGHPTPSSRPDNCFRNVEKGLVAAQIGPRPRLSTYCITPEGEVALKALIPSKPMTAGASVSAAAEPKAKGK